MRLNALMVVVAGLILAGSISAWRIASGNADSHGGGHPHQEQPRDWASELPHLALVPLSSQPITVFTDDADAEELAIAARSATDWPTPPEWEARVALAEQADLAWMHQTSGACFQRRSQVLDDLRKDFVNEHDDILPGQNEAYVEASRVLRQSQRDEAREAFMAAYDHNGDGLVGADEALARPPIVSN